MEHEDKTSEVEEQPTDLDRADSDAEQVIGGADTPVSTNLQNQKQEMLKAIANNLRG